MLKKVSIILLCFMLIISSILVAQADEEGGDTNPTVAPVDPVDPPVDPVDPPVDPVDPPADPTTPPTATPSPTPEVQATSTPTPEAQATNTPTPTPEPVVDVTSTPTPTVDPNITGTPTPSPTSTPYATVIPPNRDEHYPAPGSKSDKQVEVKSASIIKVDGIYEELWDKIAPIPIQNVAWGDNGAKGSFKMYWDKTNLYILVDVDDNTPDATDKMFSRQDCIEIFINEDGTKPSQFGNGDSHYKINYLGEVEYGHGGMAENLEYAVIDKKDGYMIEIGIPFVTVNPIFGYSFGFDIRVNDSQNNQWRDYMTQWSDTSMYTFKQLDKIGSIFLK